MHDPPPEVPCLKHPPQVVLMHEDLGTATNGATLRTTSLGARWRLEAQPSPLESEYVERTGNGHEGSGSDIARCHHTVRDRECGNVFEIQNNTVYVP